MPWEVTVLPYWLPVFHTLLVKKPQPLIWIAGQALTIRTTRMKPSISVGIQAPPKPSQRIIEPPRIQRRKAESAGRGGGCAAPPSGAAGMDAMAQWILAIRFLAMVWTFDGRATKFTGVRYFEPLPVVIPQVRKFFTGVASVGFGCDVFTIAYS